MVDIPKDSKISTIKEFLLPNSKKIKKGSIDMFMQFRNMTTSYFPDANIAADKYQVIRQDNWRIRLFTSDIRIRIIRSTGS